MCEAHLCSQEDNHFPLTKVTKVVCLKKKKKLKYSGMKANLLKYNLKCEDLLWGIHGPQGTNPFSSTVRTYF